MFVLGKIYRMLQKAGLIKMDYKFNQKKENTMPTVQPEQVQEKPDMMLEVLRFSSQKESTLGLFFDVTDGRKFLCYTLEDEFRTVKKYGETRISAGEYPISLRTDGGVHERYKQKFPDMHLGMLWVRNVPNFEYVLVHIGNKDEDTAGCTLVGDTSMQNITDEGMIGSSTSAYKRIYPPIAKALSEGKTVHIRYIDYDIME